MRRHDWPLVNPKGRSIEVVRSVRDEIADRVRQLVSAEGWSR